MCWRSGEVLPDASSDLLEHLARAARDASVWRPTQRSRSTRTPANGRTSDHCARRARATTEPAAAAAPFAKTQSARPWQLRVARRPCSRETDRCGHQIGPSCSCSTTATCAGNLCMRLLRAVWASLPACSPARRISHQPAKSARSTTDEQCARHRRCIGLVRMDVSVPWATAGWFSWQAISNHSDHYSIDAAAGAPGLHLSSSRRRLSPRPLDGTPSPAGAATSPRLPSGAPRPRHPTGMSFIARASGRKIPHSGLAKAVHTCDGRGGRWHLPSRCTDRASPANCSPTAKSRAGLTSTRPTGKRQKQQNGALVFVLGPAVCNRFLSADTVQRRQRLLSPLSSGAGDVTMYPTTDVPTLHCQKHCSPAGVAALRCFPPPPNLSALLVEMVGKDATSVDVQASPGLSRTGNCRRAHPISSCSHRVKYSNNMLFCFSSSSCCCCCCCSLFAAPHPSRLPPGHASEKKKKEGKKEEKYPHLRGKARWHPILQSRAASSLRAPLPAAQPATSSSLRTLALRPSPRPTAPSAGAGAMAMVTAAATATAASHPRGCT